MQVKDIMSSEVIVCGPQESISIVAKLIKKNNISGLPVVKEGKVVGVVSEADVLKLLEFPEHEGLWLPSPFEVIEIPIRELLSWGETKRALSDVGSRPVSDIMEKDVYVISSSGSLEDASSMMIKHRINRLPVVDDGELVGIVTRGDIIRGIAGV